MSDFKVGDEVFYLEHIKCDESEKLTPETIILKVLRLGELHNIWFIEQQPEYFKSKQECIDAFKRRLDEL